MIALEFAVEFARCVAKIWSLMYLKVREEPEDLFVEKAEIGSEGGSGFGSRLSVGEVDVGPGTKC